MPGMDGPELARRITTLNKRVKVLFMSGYLGDALAADGMMDMGAHFLEKPYTMDVLIHAVSETLEDGRDVGSNLPACVA